MTVSEAKFGIRRLFSLVKLRDIAAMEKPNSLIKTYHDRDRSHALDVLRGRLFKGSSFTNEEIQQAVKIVREIDPDHPLLRYRERAMTASNSSD